MVSIKQITPIYEELNKSIQTMGVISRNIVGDIFIESLNKMFYYTSFRHTMNFEHMKRYQYIAETLKYDPEKFRAIQHVPLIGMDSIVTFDVGGFDRFVVSTLFTICRKPNYTDITQCFKKRVKNKVIEIFIKKESYDNKRITNKIDICNLMIVFKNMTIIDITSSDLFTDIFIRSLMFINNRPQHVVDFTEPKESKYKKSGKYILGKMHEVRLPVLNKISGIHGSIRNIDYRKR